MISLHFSSQSLAIMLRQQLNILFLVSLVAASRVLSEDVTNNDKNEFQSRTTRSSSSSYGYTFSHYRGPKFSNPHSKSVSTYNGHPYFSYGKVTSFNSAPAITTYDAGQGSYGPSYDSMGGYKDPGYKKKVKEESKPQINHDEHNIEKECPYKQSFNQYNDAHEDTEHEVDNEKNYEEVDYKVVVKPQQQDQVDNQNYECGGKKCLEQTHQQEDQVRYSENQQETHPIYEGGRFIYTIYTHHGNPVYHEPVKHLQSYHVSYKPVSYGYHYSIKPHRQYIKYPVQIQTTYKPKYPSNHRPESSGYREKPKQAIKYPSENEEIEDEMKQIHHQMPIEPKYPTNYRDKYRLKPVSKYPSEDDGYDEKQENQDDSENHYDNYDSHYSTSLNTPHSSYSMQVHVPWSRFKCTDHRHPGFYADVESHCQIWHYCQPDGRQDSFKCDKHTLFNQKSLTCDWWFNVDCSSSSRYYGLNSQLYHLYGRSQHQEEEKKKRNDDEGQRNDFLKRKT